MTSYGNFFFHQGYLFSFHRFPLYLVETFLHVFAFHLRPTIKFLFWPSSGEKFEHPCCCSHMVVNQLTLCSVGTIWCYGWWNEACSAATHRASTEAKPAHTLECDILPLSSSLLVISPLMVSDSISLLTHTKHNGTARCNYVTAVATTLGLPRVP